MINGRTKADWPFFLLGHVDGIGRGESDEFRDLH